MNKQYREFNEPRKDQARLIVGYFANIAKEYRHNKEKREKRFEKAYRSDYIAKENINKRGYNNIPIKCNNRTVRILFIKQFVD